MHTSKHLLSSFLSLSFLSLSLVSLSLAACQAEEADESETRGPIGKADSVGSCASDSGDSPCGGPSFAGDCYCDDLCDGYGDCCSDKHAVCDAPMEPDPDPEPEPEPADAVGFDMNGDGYADLVVSAPGAKGVESGGWTSGNPPARVGKTFVYYGGPLGLGEQPDDERAPDRGNYFGTSLRNAGDLDDSGRSTVLISSNAFVHGSVWTDSSPLKNLARYETPQVYGNSIAVLGDVDGDGSAELAVGGNGDVFVYNTTGTSLLTADRLSGSGNWGLSVWSAGDVNGDGLGDLLIAADQQAATQNLELHLGRPGGLVAEPDQILAMPITIGRGAEPVAVADLNLDGRSDLIFGNALADGYKGALTVHFGTAEGVSATPDLSIAAPSSNSKLFGGDVANIGDTNGDQFVDVAVAAERRVHIYLGDGQGLSDSPSQTIVAPTGHRRDGFGLSVTAGDYNGDGMADLAIGAPGAPASNSGDGPGRVYLYFGSASGYSAQPNHIIESPEPAYASNNSWEWPRFGSSVL